MQMVVILERIDAPIGRETRGANGESTEGHDGSDGSLELAAIEGVGLEPGGPDTGKEAAFLKRCAPSDEVGSVV